ncbi:MAG TPA: GAF domain-containing protein [Dehalococcoidia bacterium]|nr:GAF domain-containing protein [Dehalococcoidia bacterium]
MIEKPRSVILNADGAAARAGSSRALREAGFEVTEAASAEEALALAARLPDLIVLDADLPGLAGSELQRHLRADPRTAPIPVLHLADSSREGQSAVEAAPGPDGYLLKPVASPALIATVGAMLRARQLEDAGRFLSEASAVLGASLDSRETLARIARLAVPALGELCLVYIPGASDPIGPVEAAHNGSVRAEVLLGAFRRCSLERESEHPIAVAMRSGRSVLYGGVSAAQLELLTEGADGEQSRHAVPITSYMAVPLRVNDRVLGAIGVVSADPQRPFGPSDLALAEDLARRAALAVDHARLYEAERRARRDAELASERTARLQALTASLAEAQTPAQVAAVIVDQAVSAVSASSGYVALLRDDGSEFEMLGQTGYSRRIASNWQRFRANAGSPIADAARTGEPVWLESNRDWEERYPLLGSLRPSTGSVASALLPLKLEGRVIGGMGLNFPEARQFTAEERAFLLALARQCAQALERTRLYEAERQARATAEAAQRRLAFLAGASAVLASSLDYATTLENAARLAVPALADWCFVDLVEEDDEVRRVAVCCADPADEDLARALRNYPPRRETPEGAPKALRTGQSVLLPIVPDDFLARATRDPEHLRLARAYNPTSIMYVPLLARGRTLGVLSLARTDPQRPYGPDDLRLAEDLARRAATAVDNARLHREAQEALRVRDEFLASASHDLKTPLTAIRGMTQILQRRAAKLAAPDAGATREALGTIDTAVTRMSGLVGELLDLTRLETGRPLELNREICDLAALVHSVAAEHQRLTHLHRIDVQIAPQALYGLFDPARLERAISNLLSNAVRYSPDGGDVTVSLACEGEPERVAVLRIRDAGIGVPAADLPRIFDRFYRGSNVPGKIVGTGIGLSGVRQIVEQHGGSVHAESAEGNGSLFTIVLPLDADPPALS